MGGVKCQPFLKFSNHCKWTLHCFDLALNYTKLKLMFSCHVLIGERARQTRHSFGVLNANMLYIYLLPTPSLLLRRD